MAKLQHWRTFPGIFGLEGAPMLGFLPEFERSLKAVVAFGSSLFSKERSRRFSVVAIMQSLKIPLSLPLGKGEVPCVERGFPGEVDAQQCSKVWQFLSDGQTSPIASAIHARLIVVNCAPDQTHHRLTMHASQQIIRRLGFALGLAIVISSFNTVALAATGSTAPAPAPGTPVYAVLSLVGDKLDVVVPAKTPDNKPAENVHEYLPLDSAVFDDAAVAAAAAAVTRHVPAAELARLNANAVLYEKQRALFEEKGDAIVMPDAIRAALREQGATHMVLITKLSDDVLKGFINAESTEGKIEGLGFYFDRSQPVYGADRNIMAYGSIAPFAWLRVAIIDVRTSRVLARQKITASTPIATASGVAAGTSPWNALSGEQKMNAIDRLVRREVGRAVGELLRVL